MSEQQTQAPAEVPVVINKAAEETALAFFGFTDERLQEMQQKAAKLTIIDVNDKKGAKLVKKAAGVAKKYRTSVEKKRKQLKEPALEFGRKIDAEAKRISETIQGVEKQLRERLDTYEKELAEHRQNEFDDRRQKFIDAGFVFDGSRYYVLGKLFVTPDTIEKSTDDEVTDWLKRAETEKDRVDEALKLKRDRERDTVAEQSEAAVVSNESNQARIPEGPTPPPETSGNEQANVDKSTNQSTTATSSPAGPVEVEAKNDNGRAIVINQDFKNGFERCRSWVLLMMENNKEIKTRGDLKKAIQALEYGK